MFLLSLLITEAMGIVRPIVNNISANYKFKATLIRFFRSYFRVFSCYGLYMRNLKFKSDYLVY